MDPALSDQPDHDIVDIPDAFGWTPLDMAFGHGITATPGDDVALDTAALDPGPPETVALETEAPNAEPHDPAAFDDDSPMVEPWTIPTMPDDPPEIDDIDDIDGV
jgi:hypothetical protein